MAELHTLSMRQYLFFCLLFFGCADLNVEPLVVRGYLYGENASAMFCPTHGSVFADATFEGAAIGLSAYASEDLVNPFERAIPRDPGYVFLDTEADCIGVSVTRINIASQYTLTIQQE